jgi:uncharacterized protein
MNTEDINKKLQKITDTIVKEFQPEKIILFGSYAWGEPHEWSDVDLLIIKNGEDLSRIERQREVRRIIFGSGLAVDILVYSPQELEKSINTKRNFFLEDIVRNGHILYSKHGSIATPLIHKPAELVLA